MSQDSLEKPEDMAAFFDARAAGYDEHMRGFVFTEAEFNQFYGAISNPIKRTDEPLNILDLGCGTGLELEALFQRAPNAQITGVDVSQEMLALLQRRYTTQLDQITLIADSYLTIPFDQQTYDYVISGMTIHHLLLDTKRKLYEKIRAALKPGGLYIEGDGVTLPEMESQFLAEYTEQVTIMPPAEDGHYHIDLPFSIDTQRTLLLEAGFKNFELIWEKDSTDVWNAAVYSVTS